MVIALNMWDAAVDKNIRIDINNLQRILGVPVVPTVAISGEWIKELTLRLKEAKPVEIEDIIKNTGGLT